MSAKASLASVVVVVRGVMSPMVDLQNDLSDVDPATLTPFLTTSVESGGASGPVGERLAAQYSYDPRHLLDLCERRIPSPDRVIGEWAGEYLRPDRSSPPMLLMTPQELSLIVHSPDVNGLPVKNTRSGGPMGPSSGQRKREGPCCGGD